MMDDERVNELVERLRRLTAALKRANNQAEYFERLWYLLKDENEIRDNVMGRIAIALFGDANNRTDEECVAKLAQVVSERTALRKDALRYRWLRGDSCPDHSVRWTQWEIKRWEAPYWSGDLRRTALDDALDDVMTKEG